MANYPNYYDSFVTKIDKNASGWLVVGDYFNAPASPGTIYFDHVPNAAGTTSVRPSGGGSVWVQDLTGTPAAGEYYVDYTTGQATFNVADASTELEARYTSMGDDIMAEHINILQDILVILEDELGTGIKAGYIDLAQRLNTFFTATSSFPASQVTCSAPAGPTFTDVEGHVDTVGTASASDDNPHAIGWNDIFGADGDMNRANGNLLVGNIQANLVAASGIYMGININGPDRDQYLYFYNNSTVSSEWLKWDDGDDRFELSDETYIHGAVTASGNLTVVTATPATLVEVNTSTETVTITSPTSSKPVLYMASTEDTANGYPYIRLFNDRATPGNTDEQGKIQFGSNDQGSNATYTSDIRGQMMHGTDGDECGQFEIQLMMNGVMKSMIQGFGYYTSNINMGAITINNDSADMDFKVQTATDATAFVVDSGDNQIQAGVDLVPDASGAVDLGTPALAFGEVHTDMLVVPNMKIGTSQSNAGAGFMELWADSGDGYTVKLGI